MAKTIFVDGSILTPTFMDASFGNSAITGHRHTGQNDDGSQPLIQPATDLDPVNGKLTPDVNITALYTEPVELSYDAGATYPVGVNFNFTRVGGLVMLVNETAIFGPTITAGDGQIRLRTVSGSPFNPLFWKATGSSSLAPGFSDTSGSTKHKPHTMTFLSTSSASLIVIDGTITATSVWTGTTTINAETLYSWTMF